MLVLPNFCEEMIPDTNAYPLLIRLLFPRFGKDVRGAFYPSGIS